MSVFPDSLTARIRRRSAAGLLSTLALAGLICGGAASAQAGVKPGVSQTAAGCPSSVGAVTAGGTVSSAGWPASSVPWHSVGQGWILADLATSATATGSQTLYLVSPGGQRYKLGQAPANSALKDWSGNGTSALFFSQGLNSTAGTVIVLNLHTGKASKFSVYSGSPYPSISFSRPSGTAILLQVAASQGGYLPLQRFSLTGTRQLCYPGSFSKAGQVAGNFAEIPNGTELVLNTSNGMEVVSNAGQPIRTLATQYGQDFCQMLNLWNSQTVLADCSGQLLAFPLSGAKPSKLTGAHDSGTFVGGWHLPSGTYAEAAACGTTWLEKLNSNGTDTYLAIPGAKNAGTVQPLGTYGNQLPLLLGGGCDTSFHYSFVDWYNPAANTAKTVAGGPAGGGYVTNAVLYPGS
jgi:hypothetical protein